jgi:hypothetical protein
VEDELDEYVLEALSDDEFRLAYESSECANLDRTFRRDGIYRRRWQWWYPWGVTSWQLPRVFRGGDEWCNDSACFVVPPFGCLVVFWRRGPLRTMPCQADWKLMNDSERADYAPCGYLYGGRINHQAHHHNMSGVLCADATLWLQVVAQYS